MGEILQTDLNIPHYPQLIVGSQQRDDAAVYDIGDGKAIVSTTDFFMPIVDDAETFGKIASVNAISDVYAMGAKPIMAIAILGWPKKKLPAKLAGKIMDGARKVCMEAGIPLGGGHSIDNPEPVFGLAVTGIVDKAKVRKNSDAKAGSLLYLTKPLGIGILTSAYKLGVIKPEHEKLVIDEMLKLNDLGLKLSDQDYVQTMTDVTGFGLIGHLHELCEGSQLRAEIDFNAVPQFDSEIIKYYAEKSCIPGGTKRNKEAYFQAVNPINTEMEQILYDPQTAGGLLIVVDLDKKLIFESQMTTHGFDIQPIGRMSKLNNNPIIHVK